jgi:hypothetical protein
MADHIGDAPSSERVNKVVLGVDKLKVSSLLGFLRLLSYFLFTLLCRALAENSRPTTMWEALGPDPV